jgi:uncharacterized alkaline shock family protein YloU
VKFFFLKHPKEDTMAELIAQIQKSEDPSKNKIAVSKNNASTPARIRGKTFIEDDVLAIIARTSAEQVKGVYQLGESSLRGMLSRMGRSAGVAAESGLKEAAIDVEIVVELGYSIREVAEEIRECVIETIELMTDRLVVEVNIFVVDIHVPKRETKQHRRELN